MPRVLRVLPIIQVLTLALGFPVLLQGQSSFSPQGQEYSISGPLGGDQVFPQVVMGANGGYLIWQDNAIDGNGLGIGALKLDATFSGVLSPFRINEAVAGDQNNPQAALLANGSTLVVWAGGRSGFQHIVGRVLQADGTFAGGDLAISSYTEAGQLTPVVAALSGGGAVVVWASYQQDGSMQGIFGQRLSAAGAKVGPEFPINQVTRFNQRTPSVIGLANGNFVVAWVSEQQRAENSVDVFARVFSSAGNAVGNEFLVNTSGNVSANPALAAATGGDWAVAWSQREPPVDHVRLGARTWDVYGRLYESDDTAATEPFVINSTLFGDQFAPRIFKAGREWLAVWTSMGQDGSREGIFGRFISAQGVPSDQEFGVNTTTLNRQLHPAIGGDGAGRALVIWSSINVRSGFDLFGQRYAAGQPVPQPAAPFVSPLTDSSLAISWPPLAGFNVKQYELFIDESETPVIVRSNLWTVTGLAPSSTHSFKLAYLLTDGRRSAISSAATGQTWGPDLNGDGLPDDWQTQYWGADSSVWPAPAADSDQDAVNNLREFQAGTNPTDASSVLRARLSISAAGRRLTWNTQSGLVYQVQSTTDLSNWTNVGGARFAAGTVDSVLVPGTGPSTYYRVVRVR